MKNCSKKIMFLLIIVVFIFTGCDKKDNIIQSEINRTMSNEGSKKICGDGICDAKEMLKPKLCPEDCAPLNEEVQKVESCGSDQNGYCINFHEKCKDGYIGVGPDICKLGRTAECCMPLEEDSEEDIEDNLDEEDLIFNSPFGVLKSPQLEEYYLDLGIKWTRTSAQWGIVQPQNNFQKGVYNWDALEKNWKLEQYDEDFNWLITVSFLGTPVESTGSYIPNIGQYNQENYILFVKELVKRYKDKTKYFQVENEPKIDIKDFAELQKITYKTIKEVCPECQVLIAGHAAGAETVKAFDNVILPILQELNGNYVDIFDLHWFGDKSDSNANDPSRAIDGKLTLDIVKQRLAQTNFNDIDIWITENGTYSGLPNQRMYSYQSEKEQADSLVKRYVSFLSNDVKKIFWAWGTIEGFKRDCHFFDNTGLIYDGCDCENNKYICKDDVGYDLGKGVKKLSYYTYKKLIEVLDGSDWNNVDTLSDENDIFIYKFTKNGKSIWVLWNDNEKMQKTYLQVNNIEMVNIMETIPKYESGKEVTNYNNAFNIETKQVQDGIITIELKDIPIFITEL